MKLNRHLLAVVFLCGVRAGLAHPGHSESGTILYAALNGESAAAPIVSAVSKVAITLEGE